MDVFTGHELFRVKPGSFYDCERWRKQHSPHGNLKLIVIDNLSGSRAMFYQEFYSGNLIAVNDATPDMAVEFEGETAGDPKLTGDAALVEEGEQVETQAPTPRADKFPKEWHMPELKPLPDLEPKPEPKIEMTPKRKTGRPKRSRNRKPKLEE